METYILIYFNTLATAIGQGVVVFVNAVTWIHRKPQIKHEPTHSVFHFNKSESMNDDDVEVQAMRVQCVLIGVYWMHSRLICKLITTVIWLDILQQIVR